VPCKRAGQTVTALLTGASTAMNIQQKLHNVLTYFVHRITNAVAEGLNSKIQTIKKAACGFRSFENFKTAIFFHCRRVTTLSGYPRKTRMNRKFNPAFSCVWPMATVWRWFGAAEDCAER